MKKTNLLPCLLAVTLLLSMNSVHSQQKKTRTDNTLFGQPIEKQSIHPETGGIRCASVEYEKYLQSVNSNRLNAEQFEAWIAPIIEKQKQDAKNNRSPQVIYNIPVVIHVIHNGDPINTAANHTGENISYAQAASQIAVMNQDFRRLTGTPGAGTSGYNLGVDCEINFCLAKQDPNGNPTDGVDRVNLNQASWSTAAINSTVKPQTIWNPEKYLNMWTVRFTDTTILGFAQFPSNSTLGGLDVNGGNANTDGVVANYNAFGTKALNDGSFELNSTYNLGRTMTHEVGHWLGLRHIWGDDTDCTGNNSTSGDFVTDTPDSNTPNFTCSRTVHCVGNDMVENYMDYTNDACMDTFTAGQKARMVAVMTNSPRRKELNNSNACNAVSTDGLDAGIDAVTINLANCANSFDPIVKVKNIGTTTITNFQLVFRVDTTTDETFNWTGTLAQNAIATVTLRNITADSGNHTLQVTLSNVNNATDLNTTNNAKSTDFTIVANYTENNVVFTLQPDRYGSEIKWNLKNRAGTTVQSGGPYPNASQPAVITQNWTLNPNECYTFTIEDTEGDGICCGYGQGFFHIKTASGTTIAEGSNYSTSYNKNFSTNATLSNTEFATSNEVFVYPNPTKGNLTINVDSKFGLPNNYSIANYLGQVVLQKNITTSNDLTVNTSSLSAGVYFIKVEKEGVFKTMKFIKN